MKIRFLLIILIVVLPLKSFAFYGAALRSAIGYGMSEAVFNPTVRKNMLEGFGILGWLENQGIYMDAKTGELFYNAPGSPRHCYIELYDGKDPPNRFQSPEQACEYNREKYTFSDRFIPVPISAHSTEGSCVWHDPKGTWAGDSYNVGNRWVKICPQEKDCKKAGKNELENLDFEDYEFHETDLKFLNEILSNDEMLALVRHTGKKNKKKKRRKKFDLDDDETACGIKFKKQKRKRPDWDCDDCEDGKDGADGQDGEKGDKGDKGDEGKKGDKGDKGDKGKEGDDGKDGKDKKDKKDDDCSICELRKELRKHSEENKQWREKPFARETPNLPSVKAHDFTQSRTIELGRKQCPQPYLLQTKMVGDIVFSFEWFCRFAEIIRYFVLTSASIYAAYILIGVSRRG